jgi:hypothetical protein
MKMKRAPTLCAIVLSLGLLLFACNSRAEGQDQKWWTFEDRQYYEPLIAGVREPHIGALALAWADRMPFMVSDQSPRRMWDIDMGAELPLVGWESRSDDQGTLPEGAVGFGIWLPVDFHMIEDFVDESGPIVNTDYRFGLMAKLRRGLADQRAWAVRVFVGHESTHLGDEFSIVGQRRFPREFERVNVSWEFLDIGGLYEWPAWGSSWNARLGATMTLPFQDTYYSTDPGSITQSPRGPVTESKNWIDPYAGLEVTREEIFHTKHNVGYDLYLSTEVRWRSVYDYHKTRPDAAEDRQASLNLILGVKENGRGRAIGRVSPFVRFYDGVNPHGQFRNQKDFTEMGIGLRLVR